MDDVFASPGADVDAESTWVLICQGVLAFCGLVYLLLGLVTGGLYTIVPLIAASEDPEMIVMVPFGIVMLLVSFLIAGANFAAAYGLGMRRMWAFVIALIMAALYLPSGCMPFGALLFYGLILHEPTRKQFMK